MKWRKHSIELKGKIMLPAIARANASFQRPGVWIILSFARRKVIAPWIYGPEDQWKNIINIRKRE